MTALTCRTKPLVLAREFKGYKKTRTKKEKKHLPFFYVCGIEYMSL